ncbi:uncharacterized protein LOC124673269 [Lolium rigidum]|uniref:uncharacterized protein LOC124673269 n=1 Tax=Lolium rigidum TaxID=89674 RepID=UPI001F5DF8A0|nr:uncharacterized protein LOC124673269 [Lolium rigidum]
MHDNGTLLLIGIQCFGVTDLVNKALDEEEVITAVSRTGQEVAEGINSTESELTSNRGTGTGTVAPRGEDEWLRVHGRVVAMLPQVEALAAARARLEAVNALQHEFWEARDALLQHRLLQAEESVRRWEAAYIDLQPSGDDQRFAELQRSDLEDLATFVDVFAAENAEFQIKVKEVDAGADHSQDPADHERITEDLKAELQKLKQAYEALCSEKDKKVSEITAEKDFVRDQFKTLERDYADFRSYMNNKSTQASEAALELQKNVEQLQVASQKKDEEIRKLRARVKAAEAKRKSVPESKLQKMDSMPKKIDEEIEKCKDRQPEASQRHKKDTSGTPKKGCSEGPALVTETRNYSSNQMLAEDGRPEASQKRKCATFLSNVSSEESKARSSVAVQGKLEGQQVHCTLPNIQKMSSTSRIESCGEMNIDFGFKAQEVMQAAAILDEADRLKVVELGYSTFLNLKLGPISQRKETYQCMKLVDLEEDRIKVQLQNDVIVYIRPDEIHDLLMLPQGPKAPLKYNMQQHPDFKQLRSELGETGRLDTVKILELMEKEENKQLRLKCFFLILFSRFLMPTTSQTINVNAVMYTRHLASLKEFDMCTIVYLHLRESIKLWKKQSQDAKPTSLTMYGCPIIILVFIVDNLKLTDSVNKNRPRINEYNMATLMETICKAKDNGKISFENWKLKSLEEICYAQSSRFCILSAVDSQDVRSAMAISAVPESQAIQSMSSDPLFSA